VLFRSYPAASIGSEDVQDYCGTLGQVGTGRRLVEIMESCDAARFGHDRAGESDALAHEVAELLTGLAAARLQKREPSKDKRGKSDAVGLAIAIVMTGLFFAAPLVQAEDRPGADPARLIAEGNQAYTESDVSVAIEKYLAARDLGVNDAVLHFNLGNAFARQGQLGQAVASYLRAERLSPGDPDIRANLAWVRRHITDLELVEEPLPLFIAEIAAVVRAFSVNQWGVVCLFCVWVLAAVLAWGWHKKIVTPVLRRWQLTALAVTMLIAATTGGRWYFAEVRQSAVVIVPEVVVRSGPAENFPALFEVHDGLTLSLVDEREGWVRVGLGGDWQGWISADSVVPIKLP